VNHSGLLRPSELFPLLPEPSCRPFVIALDGIGTSGKTTLAAELGRRLEAELVHMDDYFLPFEKRSETRMKGVMANIEWERLEREILRNIGESSVFSPVYDCRSGFYGPARKYDLSKTVVIEGVSSLRRELRGYYNLRLLLRISPEERLLRIEKRDPEWKRRKWRDEWIPFEDAYFSAHRPEDTADFIIDCMEQ
jgi:uridine kinase